MPRAWPVRGPRRRAAGRARPPLGTAGTACPRSAAAQRSTRGGFRHRELRPGRAVAASGRRPGWRVRRRPRPGITAGPVPAHHLDPRMTAQPRPGISALRPARTSTRPAAAAARMVAWTWPQCSPTSSMPGRDSRMKGHHIPRSPRMRACACSGSCRPGRAGSRPGVSGRAVWRCGGLPAWPASPWGP